MDRLEKLKELFEPVFAESDVVLYEMKWINDREHTLQISIMKKDGSMDLDTCADVSEKISEILDREDPIPEEYTLEVCSPGAEREIRDLNELLNMTGSYVYLRLSRPFKKMVELTGEISETTDGLIRLQYRDKAATRTAEIPLEDVEFARMAVKL
ncbi:MAG: ribosome maturation factor RimP [Solobacterium sp.]|nr:ribosome maturation factor RimP [Solobacterium sp.]